MSDRLPVAVDAMGGDHSPAAVVEGTPDEVADAIAAIDRAIAQTSAVRVRAELINGITLGGAGLVAALGGERLHHVVGLEHARLPKRDLVERVGHRVVTGVQHRLFGAIDGER